MSARANDTPSTRPPRIDCRTFCLNLSSSSFIVWAAFLFSGSPGLGSTNRNCSPRTTAVMDSVGFQSSRRMLRQTLPCRSMFGWYTCASGDSQRVAAPHVRGCAHRRATRACARGWSPHFCVAVHLGRIVRVALRHRHREFERSSSPEAIL